MTVVTFLDECNGMQFNRRRQSRDRVAIADILSLFGGSLRMTAYTAALFADAADRVVVLDDPLAGAGAEDVCVMEVPFALTSAISPLIVYRWDKEYPADQRLALTTDGWALQSATEFAGYSHDKITKEVWVCR